MAFALSAGDTLPRHKFAKAAINASMYAVATATTAGCSRCIGGPATRCVTFLSLRQPRRRATTVSGRSHVRRCRRLKYRVNHRDRRSVLLSHGRHCRRRWSLRDRRSRLFLHGRRHRSRRKSRRRFLDERNDLRPAALSTSNFPNDAISASMDAAAAASSTVAATAASSRLG